MDISTVPAGISLWLSLISERSAMSRGSVNSSEINFLGNYRAGLPSGIVWSRLRGGGWLVGPVDERGDFTGDNIAYLYPDFSTAILGQFHQGQLVRGKAARVSGVSFVEGVLWPRLTVTCEESEYRYWPSSSSHIPCPRHLRDPLEQQLLQVRQSNIPGSGEGAFARRDIPAGSLVAFYNGIKMTEKEKTPYDDSGYAIYVEFVKRW